MLIEQLLLALIGLAGGGFVSAGTFAFITMLGIVPRVAARTNTAQYILWYENLLIVGGTLGNIAYVRGIRFSESNFLFGSLSLLVVFALFSGMFVGCQAMALAELLQVMPVVAKRLRLQTGAPTAGPIGRRRGMPPGMPFVVLAIALGKMTGSFMQMFFGW